MNSHDVVLSDVHLSTDSIIIESDLTIDNKYPETRSKFTIFVPIAGDDVNVDSAAKVDDDGDILLNRQLTVSLYHSRQTTLNDVGLQVWPASMLICDYVISCRITATPLDSAPSDAPPTSPPIRVLELGCGIGFAGISLCMALVNLRVVCTDYLDSILNICQKNLQLNRNYFKDNSSLEFFNFDLSTVSSSGKYSMNTYTSNEMHNCELILCADLIYSDVITEALVTSIEHLVSKGNLNKTVIIALEKRINFSIGDNVSSAKAFDFLMKLLNFSEVLIYQFVDIDFPRYFDYQRSKEMVLLKINKVHNLEL